MLEMSLFEKNSPQDLVLRGFGQAYILSKLGIDVGYRCNRVSKDIRGVDRFQYRCEYVREMFSDDELINIVNSTSNKNAILEALGIGYTTLDRLFDYCGIKDEYLAARNRQRQENLENALVEKYGAKHARQCEAINEKAKSTLIDRYGVDSPSKSNAIRQKIKQTNLDRYGVENAMQSAEVNAKMHNTMRERYGSEHALQNGEFLEKAKATTMEHYGVEHSLQSTVIKEKAQSTMIELYGAKTTMESETLRQKVEQTCVEKYGVEHVGAAIEVQEKIRQSFQQNHGVSSPFESSNIRAKAKNTMLERHGVEHALQKKEFLEKAQRTTMEHYGVEHAAQSPDIQEKVEMTTLMRHGVKHPMQSVKLKNKMLETKRTNGTFNTSQPETTLYDLLIATFGEDDILTQYNQDSRYPFCCDFYIKSRDMFIELNAFWTHGGHWYSPAATYDTKTVQTWLSEGTEFYKNAVDTWTISDVHKRQTAKDNNLNYIVFWSDSLDDAILWFALGCPDGQDWHTEHSWLPKRKLNLSLSFPAKEKLTTSEMIIKAVKAANGNEFYTREYEIWEKNTPAKFGYTQAYMFCNRFKYINKLPDELSDFEILRGMSIARLLSGYTSFYAEPMIQTLQKYGVKSVYDPCAGWGERLLSCGINDIAYIGCDINANLHVGYNALIQNYDLHRVSVTHGDSGKVDMTNASHEAIFTCPPYYNREIYTDDGAENLSYEEFLSWWKNVVTNSVSSTTEYFMYQIDKKHRDDMNKIISESGFEFVEEIIVGKNNVRHENRATGNTTKRNYEAIQVFKRR